MLKRRWNPGLALAVGVILLWIAGAVMAQLQQSGGAATTVTANAGTNLNTSALALSATQTDRTQKSQLTDGTRDGTVKAASTAPAATDTALVVTLNPNNAANSVAYKVDGTGGSFPISGSIGNTAFALNAGSAIIGFVRVLPPGCASLVTLYAGSTVGVATGAGTSVNSTTTCITFAYANNITNSAVTLRLADKTGTPIIWLGGNADFSVPRR